MDENDIEDFDDYLHYYGIEKDNDGEDVIKELDDDDEEINELYF